MSDPAFQRPLSNDGVVAAGANTKLEVNSMLPQSSEGMMEEEILPAVEVAKELRCSKARIYKVILGQVDGVSALPIIKLGQKVIRRTSLDAWKRANDRAARQF